MAIVDLNHSDFDKEVMKRDKPVIIKFYTLWDSACRAFSAMFEDLSQEYEGKVKFCNSNVDANPDLSEQLNVLRIPAAIIFYQEKEIKRMLNPSRVALKLELDAALRKVRNF